MNYPVGTLRFSKKLKLWECGNKIHVIATKKKRFVAITNMSNCVPMLNLFCLETFSQFLLLNNNKKIKFFFFDFSNKNVSSKNLRKFWCLSILSSLQKDFFSYPIKLNVQNNTYISTIYSTIFQKELSYSLICVSNSTQ